ncbi:MAG: hypothetical protein LBQ48_00980 [Oscillospiraceae bacterium]|jgi:penicillin-binding protein 2|nr:hypothetical protein [Oscillospiraceae bacterium]
MQRILPKRVKGSKTPRRKATAYVNDGMSKPASSEQLTNKRLPVLAILAGVVILAYTIRLVDMQMVNRAFYVDEANRLTTNAAVIKAPRGEILDRYGRPLAKNREGYNIIIDGLTLPKDELSGVIAALADILTESGEEWRDNLPLTDNYPPEFAPDRDDRVTALRRDLSVNKYATAQNCFDTMIERYKLGGLPRNTQRMLMGVRYTMELDGYSLANTFTFAEDVSFSTVSKIKEQSFNLKGVDIDYAFFREYTAPDIAPHVIGGIGKIQDWSKYKDKFEDTPKSYLMDDVVGIDGIELAAEEYLRGQNGTRNVVLNSTGKVESETVTEPVPGNTVILSLDRDLQRVAQNSLATRIAALAKTNPTCTAGAAVVMKVETGEVLASATYPSYSKAENLLEVTQRSGNPLFDRALNGGYPPGSTFKPVTGIAGLETGAITPTETIRCVGRYTFYQDFQPSCGHVDGNIDVEHALGRSCNYYFFETARRTTIDNLNKFCRLLGLGVPTGVELPEYSGILAGPEERQKAGLVWNPGDTIQAGIGQSDNAFTPMQMAQYTSTIANNGSRWAARFIKEVKTYSLGSVVKANEPKLLNATGILQSNLDVIKAGMLRVTDDNTGTAHPTFKNYPIKIGGKTGTAQVTNGIANGIFIVFAPYENPEIAISVVVEHGGYGADIAPIALDIMNQYFFTPVEPAQSVPTGILLK